MRTWSFSGGKRWADWIKRTRFGHLCGSLPLNEPVHELWHALHVLVDQREEFVDGRLVHAELADEPAGVNLLHDFQCRQVVALRQDKF